MIKHNTIKCNWIASNLGKSQQSRDLEIGLLIDYQIPMPDLPVEVIRQWILKTFNFVIKKNCPLLIRAKKIEINLCFVDIDTSRKLNNDFRKRNYATNVLAFEYGIDPLDIMRGDIIICLPILLIETLNQNKCFLDHTAHLVIHGVLHTLGYDHIKNEDAICMESLESKILISMNIADPYLDY